MPDAAPLRDGLNMLKYSDGRGVLTDLDISLKMIPCQHDGMEPAGLAKQILKVTPGFQVESIAYAAHALFSSHPDQIISLI